jgi:hypothetical protein
VLAPMRFQVKTGLFHAVGKLHSSATDPTTIPAKRDVSISTLPRASASAEVSSSIRASV